MPTAQLLSHDEPTVSVHLHNHPWNRYCWPITLTSWFPPRLEHCSSHAFLLLPMRGLPTQSFPGWLLSICSQTDPHCLLWLRLTMHYPLFGALYCTSVMSFQAPGHKGDHIAGNNSLPSSLPFPIPFSTPPPIPPLALARYFPTVTTSLVVKLCQSAAYSNKHIETL